MSKANGLERVVRCTFRKEKVNPIELIKTWWPDADIRHIQYDPNMKAGDRDYWRIEHSAGDGTLLFTIEMLQKALLPLLNKTTYYNQTPKEDLERAIDIKYKIGPIWHSTVFGMIYLRCSTERKYRGQKERVRIPVKCEYVYS
jgi:hypothetical protein